MEKTEQDDFLAAFEGAMAGASQDKPHADPPAEAKVEEEKPAAQTEEVKQPADPLAAVPSEIRDELERLRKAAAQLPLIEQQYRSERGRREAYERKLREAEAAKPKEKPKFAKIEAIRNDMPEVAEALEEIALKHVDQPAPVQEVASEPQPIDEAQRIANLHRENPILTARHPKWVEEINSQEFNLWFANQDPSYRAYVQDTDDQRDLILALDDFSKFKAATQERVAATKVVQARQARVADAVAPQTAAKRPPPATSEQDEFEAAFKRARGQR